MNIILKDKSDARKFRQKYVRSPIILIGKQWFSIKKYKCDDAKFKQETTYNLVDQ